MNKKDFPSVVLLLLDTASANRFSLYGHSRATSPCLERLAPAAAVYRHCFTTAPWTMPSHVSLFTGLYPHEHGSNTVFSGLPGDLYTLPEVLGEMGYHTVGISSNLLISRALGFHRGFAEFYEMGTFFQDPRYLQTWARYRKAKKDLKGDWDKIKYLWQYMKESGDFAYPLKKVIDRYYKKYFANIKASTAFMTRRSMRLGKRLMQKCQTAGEPFFLFINLMETHGTFNAPYPFNRKFQKVDRSVWKKFMSLTSGEHLYIEDPKEREERGDFWSLCADQEILFVDSVIGDFCDFLRKQDLLDRTLLIITSDHGEGFGEHGLFAHAFGLYNELVHIPLVIKYPRDYGIKGEFTGLTQLNDIFATLCQVADTPLPVPFSSHSLLDGDRSFALTGLLDNQRGLEYLRRRFGEFKVWSCMLPGLAWVGNDLWKLIRWEDGTEELYDLNRDLPEQNNLIEDPIYSDKAKALRSQMANFLDSGAVPEIR